MHLLYSCRTEGVLFVKIFRWCFLIAILAGFAWLLGIVSRDAERGPSPETSPEASFDEDIGVEHVGFSEWKGPNRTWTLEARRMKYYHHERRVDFEEASVSVLDPEGGRFDIRADRLRYEGETGNLEAEGNVEGRNEQGYVFRAPRLSYEAAERRIATMDKVTLRKDRISIQGVGMKASLKDRKLELLSSVEARLVPNGYGEASGHD